MEDQNGSLGRKASLPEKAGALDEKRHWTVSRMSSNNFLFVVGRSKKKKKKRTRVGRGFEPRKKQKSVQVRMFEPSAPTRTRIDSVSRVTIESRPMYFEFDGSSSSHGNTRVFLFAFLHSKFFVVVGTLLCVVSTIDCFLLSLFTLPALAAILY